MTDAAHIESTLPCHSVMFSQIYAGSGPVDPLNFSCAYLLGDLLVRRVLSEVFTNNVEFDTENDGFLLK